MFHRSKVIAALETKSGRFAGHEVALLDALAVYEKSLIELAGLSKAEIEARLKDVPWPGALPTVEHDQHPDVVVPFGHTWTNHQQARDWAKKVLSGVPTVAVDGSQITPTKDVSVPVGAVQIGWFINPHDSDWGYVKDIRFEVLAPDELSDEDEEIAGFPDWRVNVQRFILECEKLVEMMEDARDVAVWGSAGNPARVLVVGQAERMVERAQWL